MAGHQPQSPSASNFAMTGLPHIAYGQGSWLVDVEGRRYLDGSGGPAVYCLGHAHPEVNAAIKAQIDKVAHAYRYMFTSDAADELAEIVRTRTDGHFPGLVFVSGGSEAVESCLKIALQYFAAQGRMTKRRFIARQRSWHGNTLGALSVSGFRARRAPFEGSLLDVSFLSAANDYRPADGVAPERLVEHLAAELEQEIERVGAEHIAAFIFEPVVGAAGGVVPAPAGYAARMVEICRRHDILVIADEVMCGAGRCGTWRALAEDDAVPDLMSVAKGLAGGYLPLGAALYGPHVQAVITEAYGAPMTGHTFTGHTTACAAGVAVQRIVERDGLLERVRERGATFQAELRAALADIDEVGDVRGRGYFIGIELVADLASRRPFPAAAMLHARIGQAAFQRGLICYPCTGNVNGTDGDTVILAPPYNVTDDELNVIATTLPAAIKDALGSIDR